MKTLEHISASKYLSFKLCPLQEIWKKQDKERLLPLHPNAWIGIISHEILESSGKGKISNKDDFDQKWDKTLENLENKMGRSRSDKHLVPLADFSSLYEVKKIMTWRMVQKFLESRGHSKNVHLIGVEETLVSNDSRIVGRIDSVRSIDGYIEISDFKTGTIFDGKGLIKEAYQVQLKIYAALYYEVHGEWPRRLIIAGLGGERFPVAFTEKECFLLLDDIRMNLENVNNRILSGATEEDLARPSPDACNHCFYRPECSSYWGKNSYSGDWPKDIRGKVIEKTISGMGSARVLIKDRDKEHWVRGLSTRHGIHSNNYEYLTICNLSHDTVEEHYIENMMTMCLPSIEE